MSDTINILRTVRERLSDPENWRQISQGGFSRRGPTCLGLALDDADDSSNKWRAAQHLGRTLGFAEDDIERGTMGLIFGWNDAPERTHADVLAALDKAIETEQA